MLSPKAMMSTIKSLKVKQTYKCGVRSCQRRGTLDDGIKCNNGLYRCEDHYYMPAKSVKKTTTAAPPVTPGVQQQQQQQQQPTVEPANQVPIPVELFMRLLRDAHRIADELRQENEALRAEITQFRQAKLELGRFVTELATKFM